MTKQLAGTEAEFDAVLDIIIRHREKALNNVNVENLLTNWEIGAFISRRLAQAAWGSAAIDGLVDHIRRHDPMAKGYGRRNLYNMVAVYDSFSSNEFMELLRRWGNCAASGCTNVSLCRGCPARGWTNHSACLVPDDVHQSG